ncbi:MAG: hypothetical protein ACRERZ_03255 [Gammaproteobacteria bacterium]
MNTASSDYRELTSSADNRDAAVRLASEARVSLAMFTRDLDPVIYNTEEFATAVRQLALRSRYSRIRVVAIDPTAAIKDGHRLIELGRRLSSFIEFRRPSADHAKLPESFLVADETGLLYRPVASRYEGFADPDNPVEARVRLRLFDEIWERAEPEPEFRRLGM